MGIKSFLKKASNKVSERIAKSASLTEYEIQEVENKRTYYLLGKPDLTSEEANELTNRYLGASSVEIFNSYLTQLSKLYLPIKNEVEYDGEFKKDYNTRFINITKWVISKEENSLEKLISVYSVLKNESCNIALIFDRKIDKTNVYLSITNLNNESNNVSVDSFQSRILNSLKGNFPGSQFQPNKKIDLSCFDEDGYSVAISSNIPNEKSEKFISQTIEKLLDGIVPENGNEEYTLILLATPILDVEERKLNLSNIYSALYPYQTWQTNFTYNDSVSFGSSANAGVNLGLSAGIQSGTANNTATSDSKSESTSESISQSSSDSNTNSSSESESKSNSYTQGENHAFSANFGVGGSKGYHASSTTTDSHSSTIGRSLTKTISESIANTLGNAITKTKSISSTITQGKNFGGNFGVNFARSSSVSATIGKNEGISQNFVNYSIKHALELLEKQMNRLDESSALGMWDFAAYVISKDFNVANNVAHTYTALTEGKESHLSTSAINLWRGDLGENSNSSREIIKYLKNMRHPIFGLNPHIVEMYPDFSLYPTLVEPTTSLSGKELSYSLNFPRKSIAGLPVIECSEFGRNISKCNDNKNDRNLKIGQIFHMNQVEKAPVLISKQSLAAHTFITGSTGSGKSNTVYKLLDESRKEGIKFLVIEPAKGEYKTIFGNEDDVNVFGTNPHLTPLLKLNPFSFPKEIHILEHLDRLVEIFNVCWPMYAAMPAVLKNAIEKAYIDCGWDLIESKNKFKVSLYPTFNDVAIKIKEIIESSEYDNENKGAYKGALITRLESLSNGINGLIFVQDELDTETLFEENTIIDLSRVGSSETKSLIMGMLVLKLQEHRMSSIKGINQPLKHITVLEEAHNLLKNTLLNPSEQNALASKSVEMLANSIAEMRTYGEGFVIVDQSPGLLDMSVIRNTNTKIIMRLPDFDDRNLVGKAANLNENQIIDIAKIPCGVAAVFQNEWIEPVLCKVDFFRVTQENYRFTNSLNIEKNSNVKKILLDKIVKNCIFNYQLDSLEYRKPVEFLSHIVKSSDIDNQIKICYFELINSDKENIKDNLSQLLHYLCDGDNLIYKLSKKNNADLQPINSEYFLQYSNREIAKVILLIFYYEVTFLKKNYEIYQEYVDQLERNEKNEGIK